MRDPSERLGAGEPGTANDMKALRAHPFFATINWSTLWTDPSPPLEAGLVKKEPQMNGASGLNGWEDVGAQWDDMVDGDGDDMSWASDGEGVGRPLAEADEGEGIYMRDPFSNGVVNGNAKVNGYAVSPAPPEVGPLGETRPYQFPPLPDPELSPVPTAKARLPSESHDTSEPQPPSILTPSEPSAPSIPIPTSAQTNTSTSVPAPISLPPSSPSADTQTNSVPSPSTGVRFSDASPTQAEKDAEEDRDTVPPTLDDVPMAVRTQPIDVPPRTVRDSYSTGSTTSSSDGSPVEKMEALDPGLNRGRNRAQTPIQGNGPSRDEEW